jgi:hypothetical protein
MRDPQTHAPRQAAEGTVRGKGKRTPAARRGATALCDILEIEGKEMANGGMK